MDADISPALCEAVAEAYRAGQELRILGSGSKGFLCRGPDGADPAGGRLLSTTEHRGVLDYRPEELVLTARAGTPLKEVEQLLDRAGQHLPFEPPRFHGGGTLGGAVAAGLSGPGRPWRGGVRDALLGVELINGCGERLRFGGQVMKNVAGYDVSRLQAGAFGTLGVLLAVSVKVLPKPARERTVALELDPATALARCRGWMLEPLPITATCYYEGVLRVRLSGAEPAVNQAAAALGGETDLDEGFWSALRDHRWGLLAPEREAAGALWRATLTPAEPRPLDHCLVEWAGALRWWRAAPAEEGAAAGDSRPFAGAFAVRTASDPLRRRYQARLKRAFDPGRVLNPELSPAAETDHAD